MDSAKEALMAQNNYLMYQEMIDENKAKDEEHLLFLKKEAAFWYEKYSTVSEKDSGIWNALGLTLKN
jgi:hypothetical protein